MGFCGRRYCGDVGGGCLGGGPPLGRPVALTLALSRRAGEGTVVVGGGASATRVVFQEMGLLRGGGWLLWERAGVV